MDMSAFMEGGTLLLAALLLGAGAMKLVRPRPFSHALYRLLPVGLAHRPALATAAAPAVGIAELLVGVGLLGSTWWKAEWSSAAAAGAFLYAAFVGVILVAFRKGSACGCWSSFSDGPAGGAELGRALALAMVAAGVLAAGLLDGPPRSWRWLSPAWALTLAVAVAAVAAIGWRLLPACAGSASRLPFATRAGGFAAMLLGRVTSRNGNVSLLTAPPLPDTERLRIVSAARSCPSVLAFKDWLGERAGDIDWDGMTARPTTVRLPGHGLVSCVLLTAHSTQPLHLTVSVPLLNGQPSDAVVMARVDGTPVAALAGRVLQGLRPVDVTPA